MFGNRGLHKEYRPIDPADPHNPFVIGRHALTAVNGKPHILWSRETRSSKTASLMFSEAGKPVRELDRGMIGSIAICGTPDRGAFTAWEKMQPDGGCCITILNTRNGEAVFQHRAYSASELVLACTDPSAEAEAGGKAEYIAAAWAEITDDGRQVIKTLQMPGGREPRTADSGTGAALNTADSGDGWAARPGLCRTGEEAFFLVWEEYRGRLGVFIRAAVLRRGTLSPAFTIFPNQESSGRPGPHLRFLNPDCIAVPAGVLVTAVEVQDVVSAAGVFDQSSRIVSALISRQWLDECGTGGIEKEKPGGSCPPPSVVSLTGPPVSLNHGLLSDITVPTGVWGYLGPRRAPFLTGGPFLLWERKAVHDGFTPDEEGKGLLCACRFDAASAIWEPEEVLHSGSYSYSSAAAGDALWLLHRPVSLSDGHSLLLEKIRVRGDCSGADGGKKAGGISLLQPEGGYRPAAADDVDMPPKKERAQEGPAGLSLYWGDPHVHSVFSKDPEGEPDELLYYASETAGLDFTAVTDNDEHYGSWLQNWERRRVFEICRAWNRRGRFIVLDGLEFTRIIHTEVKEKNHRTVIFERPEGSLFRWSDFKNIKDNEAGLIEELAGAAEEYGALLIAHHQNWELSSSSREIGIEAVSGWDSYLHDSSHITAVWDRGLKMCLIGGSDNHRRNPGHGGALTGIWAKELSYSGLIDGIRNRRTIASQGRRPRIELSLHDEEERSLFIGDSGRLKGLITVRISVDAEEYAGDTIEFAEIIHRNRSIANWGRADTEDGGRRLRVSQRLTGSDSMKEQSSLRLQAPKYLYLRLRMNGKDRHYPSNIAAARGPWAWTTPIWWD